MLAFILAILSIVHLSGQTSCVRDITPPVFQACTSDTTIVLSDGTCDSVMTFAYPSITDNCDQIGFADDFAPSEWVVEQFGDANPHEGKFITNLAPAAIAITGNPGDLTDPFDPAVFDTIKVCKHFVVGGMVTFSWNAEMTGSSAIGQFVNDESWYVHDGNRVDLAISGAGPLTGGPINILVTPGDSLCFYVQSNSIGDYDSLTITDWNFTQSRVYALSPTPVATSPTGASFLLGMGTHTITWEAIDSSGNTATCDFDVTVQQAFDPDAACKNINLSLDSICRTVVIPEMVYSGDTTRGFCNDAFTLTIEDQWGNIVPDNIVNGSYSGQELNYSLYVKQTNNSCWGTILVEDKYPPQIVCRDDTMDCFTFQNNFTPPSVIDNCSQARAILIDELVESKRSDPDFIKVITQTWVAEDAYGNTSAPCTQVIRVQRFPIGAVTPPVADTSIDCRVNIKTLPSGAPDPSVSGVPTLNGQSIYPFGDAYCNVFVTFRDIDFQEVGCTKKILRIWSVSELWGGQEFPRYFTQNIKIVDTSGPVVTLPRTFLEATTGKRSCEANVWLPEAQYFDECHDIEGIIIRYTGGVLYTNGGLIKLPVGIHNVEYDVFDKCYNHTSIFLEVRVRDETPPVAVCHRHTTVGIHNKGYADVLAQEFDDGSFDECLLDSMQVRRMEQVDPCGAGSNEWGRTVRFCCDDIGKTIQVELRVWDASGNFNRCMVSVEVQDKVPPTIICPPDITVDCRFDWDPNHLEVFGDIVAHDSLRQPINIHSDTLNFSGPAFDGVAYDNCPMAVDTSSDVTNINNCGTGYILRFFTITDAQGAQNFCTQRISFVQKDTFGLINITWPLDYLEQDSCNTALFNPDFLPDSSARPTFTMEDECSLVGATYKDDTVRVTRIGDACFKVIRHWQVIDWCQEVDGVFKRWAHDQVLKMINTIPPEFTSACRDTMKCFYNADCSAGTITLTETATDDCTPANELFWQYRIDLGNDGTWDIYQRDSNTLTRAFPIDTHRIEWQVEDKCGNYVKCDYLFEMRNCKAPTAYCKNGLVVELTPMDTTTPPDGVPDVERVTVLASDLDAGSSHVCGYPVVLSFSSDTSDTERVYDCDSLGIRDVEIWVTDLVNGNTSVCKTTVNVQDNNNVDICPANLTGVIAGAIATDKDQMIDGVEVLLDGSNGMKVASDQKGVFAFPPMPLGSSYKIIPSKDDDYMKGVSTRDLVTIQKHLLGIKTINSPYQLIAADANNSGSVSTSDVATLRKLILGRVDRLSKVGSWRFVEKEFVFTDPANPFATPFPEQHDLDPFDRDIKMNFIGIKIGDVNGDIKLGNLQNVDVRSDRSMEITMNQLDLKQGDVYEITLSTEDIEVYEGYQFTLNFDPNVIRVLEVIPNDEIDMGLSNFNLNEMENGKITTSWSSLATNVDKQLFNIKLQAFRNVQLSDVFRIATKGLQAEAYGTDGSLQSVNLGYRTESVEAYDNYFALYQNEPNPWTDITTIGFHLPKAQKVVMTIYDHTGKVLYVTEGDFEKGYNEFAVDRSEVTFSGTIFYQLNTDGHTATRKMVVLR